MAVSETEARRTVDPRAPRTLPALPRTMHLPALFAAAWALFLLSWAVSNPPFLAPDEPSHYTRAISVSAGRFGPEHVVNIPPGLWGIWTEPGGITCNAGRSRVSGACVERAEAADIVSVVWTAAGAYPPLYYLLPGLALRTADDPFTADRLGRLVAAATCLLFLVLGVALLASPQAPRVALLGVLLATTPMALFIMASINTSGLEIAAGIAFFAALLRLARDVDPPGWVLGAAGASGLVLALSRSTGAAWVLLDLALFVALLGPRQAFRRVGRYGATAVAVAGVVVVAVVANRLWEEAHGDSVTQRAALGTTSVDSFLEFVRPGIVQLPRVFDEEVGVFGWVDTLMPGIAYIVWQSLVAILLGIAFMVGSRRERMVLVLGFAAALAAVVVVSAVLQSTTGQDVQGRHVLPFTVVVPLLAGEIVLRNRSKLALADTGVLFTLFAVGTAAIHVVAWHANGQRQAVGSGGPVFFVADAEWSPPLGWTPWLLVTLAAGALTALAPALARRHAGPRATA